MPESRNIWGVDRPLSDRQSLFLGIVACLVLLLAVGGFFIYDGWHRVAYVSAFLLIAAGNFCMVIGSRWADPVQGRMIRSWATPISIVMLLALAWTMLFQFGVIK